MELFFDTLRYILTMKAFWFLAAMVVLSTLVQIKLPKWRGAFGERTVRNKLTKLGDAYHTYHDLYVPNEVHGLTQIDHVIVSKYGLHVIETKHYSGWIFGSEKQKYWTQVIYKNKQKLYSPIRQNYGHIEALRTYIGNTGLPAHSIIAFSDQVEFKFKEEFISAKVVHYHKLIKTIRRDETPVLTESQVNEIVKKLEILINLDKQKEKAIRKEHLQLVKEKQRKPMSQKRRKTERMKPVSQTIEVTEKVVAVSTEKNCPRCDGRLVNRNGKRGQFLGCESFPRCRYTEDVCS